MSKPRPRILVAPLDWGLGHATRCIPIIRGLLTAGCEVIIGADGDQQKLLALEFPSVKMLSLRGYHIKYSKNPYLTLASIILQLPKILIRIKQEKAWLRRILDTEKFDAVISDNRYGLYSAGVYSVFITHQLCISVPFNSTVEALVRKMHYRLISKFNCCWVPDQKANEGLSGRLGHPAKLPSVPVAYIGPVSRFAKSTVQTNSHKILFILSGPEPQRTSFERLVLKEMAGYSGEAVLVRGLPNERNALEAPSNLLVYQYAASRQLNELINTSEFIISRSGYSTVMDLVKLGKKAIFVPTPGQTEQEYLAAFLMEKKIAFSVNQRNFSLIHAMSRAEHFSFKLWEPTDAMQLDAALNTFIKQLENR